MEETTTIPDIYDKAYWQDRFEEALKKSGIIYGLNEKLSQFDGWFSFSRSNHTIHNAKAGTASITSLQRIINALDQYNLCYRQNCQTLSNELTNNERN